MKNGRQKKILEIISSRSVETQKQLLEELHREGIESTQATLSRDIRDLRLVKEMSGDGTYRYAMPQGDESEQADKLRKIFTECVTSFVCAQNIIVIKTLPGLASAACSAVDKMMVENLAGTLAGDDTAFLAMLDNESAQKFCEEIKNMI